MAQRQTEKCKYNAGKKPNFTYKKPASDKSKIRAENQVELNTLLLNSAANNDYDGIRRLVKWGADITAKDNDGWTPLHHAALFGHTKICALLIREYAKTGGDVYKLIAIRNNDNKTAIIVSQFLAGNHPTTQLLSSFELLKIMDKKTFRAFMNSFNECISI